MAFQPIPLIVSILILLWIFSFIILAILRIVTGVSVQRFGLFSIKRLSWTPRDGVRIEIKSLGFSLHRPTFSQPTWVSFAIKELRLTLTPPDHDLNGSAFGPHRPPQTPRQSPSRPMSFASGDEFQKKAAQNRAEVNARRGKTWQQLTQIKERLKQLHSYIQWLRLFDVAATNTIFTITGSGSFQVGQATIAVDTRRRIVDRSRIFFHRKDHKEGRHPAEWFINFRNILFTADGKESIELLDSCSLNIHGLLYQEKQGLRDASMVLKLGRLTVPYDDLADYAKKARRHQHVKVEKLESPDGSKAALHHLSDHDDQADSREENIIRAVSDSRDFVSSMLRGIQEFQFAVGFVGITKEIRTLRRKTSTAFMHVQSKELSMDLVRLDPRSPAHRMYFSPDDTAHQAMVAAISVSVGFEHGNNRSDRLLYIPMATGTARTTLPAKTIQITQDGSPLERNRNILYANVVCTSPSIDLDPQHLPLLLTILRRRRSSRTRAQHQTRQRLISRLLPKASIKLSIHEPVLRVVLPPMDEKRRTADEFDLLISTMSSISVDVESSHSDGGQLHYSLSSNFRVSGHQFYYQTATDEKHNVLITDSWEVKVQLYALPEIQVIVQSTLQTFAVYIARPEICEGIRQLVSQLHTDVIRRQNRSVSPQDSFIRRLPFWLQQAQFQAYDFSIEIAGADEKVSPDSKGFALQLESWNANYVADRHEPTDPQSHRRRAGSRNNISIEALRQASPSPARKRKGSDTDGRRLAVHLHGFEGFIVESDNVWESDSFCSIPRFEVAFSTSSDMQGPIFHINSVAKSILLHYSIHRHYALAVATALVRKIFVQPSHVDPDVAYSPINEDPMSPIEIDSRHGTPISPFGVKEITTIDFRASFIQIKATMPNDPPLMFHAYGLETGRHRWSLPFIRSKLLRLYSTTPNVKHAWSRIVSIKSFRIDLRELKRKRGTSFVEEKTIDIVVDAIRIGVPHQLIVHKIFDNITNIVKSSKQLYHRLKTGLDDNILIKGPEEPKQVPKITFRTQVVLFEIEDDILEYKIGTIYRLGLVEQQQRTARENAFKLKEKSLGNPGVKRGRSTFRHQRSRSDADERSISPMNDGSRPGRPGRRRSSSISDKSRKYMRYDTTGACKMSKNAKRTIEQAREKLDQFNAQSWKKRVDRGLDFQKSAIHDIRRMFWGLDDPAEDVQHTECILSYPFRPALAGWVVSDFNIVIDKPSFPASQLPDFLHKIGKGMPKDMQYSLLIPMNVNISMGEMRLNLRDYPLPAIHIPAIRPGQSPRLPSLSLKTDFVIAEEFCDSESTRMVKVEIVKPQPDEGINGLVLEIPRTVAPVKTYSDILIEINTSLPTRFTWGTSYQPAIQDMMQVIEGFTKQPLDPSDRVGFWDKIRLSFHSRAKVVWKGDGDVHLTIKGSRDPYMVTGQGTGFVMCWRNDVQWNIATDPDPKKFMTVDSGDYVLAVPDFSHYARETQHDNERVGSDHSSSPLKHNAMFKKVIMKLSGNVRWLAGLKMEREAENSERHWTFKPHYKVILKNPDSCKAPLPADYDAYAGFRSNWLHLSIAISAPANRDWSFNNLTPSHNYNSIHLSPRFFTHFFSWWSMFSGTMSLPIRQGRLFTGPNMKPSKKFGRHIATIKYNLLFSPLLISHIYKYKELEDFKTGTVSATGLKVKLNSFMLDVHQRREEVKTQAQGVGRQEKSSRMKINATQLDFISADIRAVSATITGTNTEDIDKASNDVISSFQQNPNVDMARFTIPDNDFSWIDMDDFVEIDWILPTESDPETKILPLAYAPRFSYLRQTDHPDPDTGKVNSPSKFGDEPTHNCVMSGANDPRRVQCNLILDRITAIESQIEKNQHAINNQEVKIVKEHDNSGKLKEELSMLHQHSENLRVKIGFLKAMLAALRTKLENNDISILTENEISDAFYNAPEHPHEIEEVKKDSAQDPPPPDSTSEFNNRFVIHNPQIKWNNSLRDIILRYVHQNSQRRGFVYYMSRRAVKFILDVLDEQQKSRDQGAESHRHSTGDSTPAETPDADEQSIQERIDQLLNDGRQFVNAEEPNATTSPRRAASHHMDENIATEFTAMNSYNVRLIAPQLQLQSEKNSKSAVLVTAKGMQLKVVQIMDKDRVTDDISGLVQRRFAAEMESVQFFVTNRKTFSTDFLHMYSGNRFGCPAHSSWPPWVPLEVMYDYEQDPYGFSRVVQRTSASLRYEKYNTLRLKGDDDVTGGETTENGTSHLFENRMDNLWIDFPQIKAICDSTQYYAIYIIIADLLIYSEPLEKIRNERLEKIMLASDFSDLRGIPETVTLLQERIRQLEEIKVHFQVNEKFLDRRGWKDRINLDRDLIVCEDELFFMMKAITSSQRRLEDRTSTQVNGLLRWSLSASQIAWHLVRGKNESLLEFQLRNASFERTDNSDGSNMNCVEIERIVGLNLLHDAIYPEIIAPYQDTAKAAEDLNDSKMLSVHWLKLEAIAGIAVVDRFEINLVPLRIQLEREVGKRLFEYIFPGAGANAFENGGFSPFMVKNMISQKEDEQTLEHDRADSTPEESPVVTAEEFSKEGFSGTGVGALELRLHPTRNLPTTKHPKTGQDASEAQKHRSRLGILQNPNRSRSATPRGFNTDSKVASSESIAALSRKSEISDRNGSTTSVIENNQKSRRLTVTRKSSQSQDPKSAKSDDLSQMLQRASNYMTIAYFKVPSVVLCLSYKGKGHRNIEDVHDLVFRMPTLEYRNKTWSNLDLALQLKKDVIRALISHAGTILGNKFSHHRPNKQQQSRLREIANSSTLMASSEFAPESSTPSSFRDHSPASDSAFSSTRPSVPSSRGSALIRSESASSMGQMRESSSFSGLGIQVDAASSDASLASSEQANGETSTPHNLSRSQLSLNSTQLPVTASDTVLLHPQTPRLISSSTILHRKPSVEEDSESTHKRKSRLLLGGKKLIQSLSK